MELEGIKVMRLAASAIAAVLILTACGGASKDTSNVNMQALISSAHQADDAGDFTGCIAGYTRALSIQSDIVGAYSGRAHCYSEQGNSSAAVQDYSQALKLSPDDPELFLLRGDAEQELGNKSAAAADYKRISQNSSSSPSQILRAAQ